MKPPPIPQNESLRIETLRGIDILDTPPEERFDKITRLASDLLHVPIALVSLVDEHRQWFKSRQGLDAFETTREISFCGYAILRDGLFIVEDAGKDERFSDNPLVTSEPFIRFYAGRSLSAVNGVRMGTLCVIDQKPRKLEVHERRILDGLGAWAEREINFVTERQAMLEKIEGRLLLASILDHMAEGVINADHLGTIESANESALKMFGYDRPDLVGQNIRLLIPERERAAHAGYMAHLQNLEDDITRKNLETIGRRSDGSEFPVEISYRRLILGDRHLFTGIVRDISERKELERKKNEFVAMVSHELRSPVTSIIGALSILDEGEVGELPDEMQPWHGMAMQNAERLSKLIDDILDVEKLSTGTITFELAPVEIGPLLDDTLRLTMAHATSRDVALVIDSLPAPLPLRISADRSRLTQVLTNLISNAVKFSPKGGVVSVSAVAEVDSVRISVVDQGPGIPESDQTRIFDKFFQVDSTITRRKGGAGLGLYISKAMIEGMEGKIWCESAPESGTAFHLLFNRVT